MCVCMDGWIDKWMGRRNLKGLKLITRQIVKKGKWLKNGREKRMKNNKRSKKT